MKISAAGFAARYVPVNSFGYFKFCKRHVRHDLYDFHRRQTLRLRRAKRRRRQFQRLQSGVYGTALKSCRNLSESSFFGGSFRLHFIDNLFIPIFVRRIAVTGEARRLPPLMRTARTNAAGVERVPGCETAVEKNSPARRRQSQRLDFCGCQRHSGQRMRLNLSIVSSFSARFLNKSSEAGVRRKNSVKFDGKKR